MGAAYAVLCVMLANYHLPTVASVPREIAGKCYWNKDILKVLGHAQYLMYYLLSSTHAILSG